MLQDQHWHDVAQIAAERDATGHLKVKLQRTQNEFLKQKYAHKDVRSNGVFRSVIISWHSQSVTVQWLNVCIELLKCM